MAFCVQSSVVDVYFAISVSLYSIRMALLKMILFCTTQIPEEEKNLGPHDRLIHVYHFSKETAQNQMVIKITHKR